MRAEAAEASVRLLRDALLGAAPTDDEEGTVWVIRDEVLEEALAETGVK